MNDMTRAELLRLVAELCEIFPEMRLGQLVCNLASLADDAVDAVGTIEDRALCAESEAFLAAQLERLGLRPPSFLAQRLARIGDGEPLSSHPRLNLLVALRDCGRRHPRLPFGRLVANLAALAKVPETVTEWAAAVWDIEDETLLSRALEVLKTPALDLESTPVPADALSGAGRSSRPSSLA